MPIYSLIKSNVVQFVVTSEPPKGNVNLIPLQYHSNRGHWNNNSDKYSPLNLLIEDMAKNYWSMRNKDFSDDESDWIVFKFLELYFPIKYVIKNKGEIQDVKSMKIFIGDGVNKWYPFNSNEA
eukprot:77300_1